MSAGFGSAFQIGSGWAVAGGASYRYGASYTPVNNGEELTPGGEIRARLGVEGPYGGHNYFRGALLFTRTGANDISGGTQSTIGDRWLVYGATSMPIGTSQLSVYGWDMRRFRARSSTYPVPRGNILALGARLERLLSPRTTLVPLVELRHELTGPGENMELLGYLVRAGTDLQYRLSDRATGVLQAQFAVGSIRNETGQNVSVTGPRLGVMLAWVR
jgi:hypothetical protein